MSKPITSVDTSPSSGSTYHCFACQYSSKKQQKDCIVCRGQSQVVVPLASVPVQSPQKQEHLRANKDHQRQVSFIEAEKVAKIYTYFPDEKEAENNLTTFATKRSRRAPETAQSTSAVKLIEAVAEKSSPAIILTAAAEDNIPTMDLDSWEVLGCHATQQDYRNVKILEEYVGVNSPAIVLTAAEDSNPTMDVHTWKALGKCSYKESTVEVMTMKQPKTTRSKHRQSCPCDKCGSARWVDASAKMLFGDLTQKNEEWKPSYVPPLKEGAYKRERRIWWMPDALDVWEESSPNSKEVQQSTESAERLKHIDMVVWRVLKSTKSPFENGIVWCMTDTLKKWDKDSSGGTNVDTSTVKLFTEEATAGVLGKRKSNLKEAFPKMISICGKLSYRKEKKTKPAK